LRRRLQSSEVGAWAIATFLVLAVAMQSRSQERATNIRHFITQPLSLAEATDIALQQNPSLRRARKEIEAAQGILIQTRAIVLPKVQLGGAFNAVQDSDVDKPATTIPGFTFGTDKTWNTQLRIAQSIYEGGRMTSALRVG